MSDSPRRGRETQRSAPVPMRAQRFPWRLIIFAARGYLRAALYSSAALSQFTTFHQASM